MGHAYIGFLKFEMHPICLIEVCHCYRAFFFHRGVAERRLEILTKFKTMHSYCYDDSFKREKFFVYAMFNVPCNKLMLINIAIDRPLVPSAKHSICSVFLKFS
jgi:hypothetical protein